MIPSNDATVASSLAVRLAAGESEQLMMVPPLEPWPADWSPEGSECHKNAKAWVACHSGYSVVHGWLHIAGQLGHGASFEAHSVVRSPDGELRDVTKPRGAQHLFLRHLGPADEYEEKSRPGGPWVHVVESIDPLMSNELAMGQALAWANESIDALPPLFPTD